MPDLNARRTKIVATLGPTTDDKESIAALIAAGVNVVRLNFSHGNADDHRQRCKLVRECAKEAGRQVGVLADLQGPKIRIDRFSEGKVILEEGDAFILDAECDPEAGDKTRVGIAYKKLPSDVSAGDTLLLDDGRIVLKVSEVKGAQIHCIVEVAGALSNNKGINRQGGGLSADALTEKDKADIIVAAEIEADYIAVSFPRCAADITYARELLDAAGGHGGIVAKIERTEALDNIEEIIIASDVIMIARGDLGVEIGDAELPAVQKHLIKLARAMNRLAITATQMMESMIENPIPTRAEVFDVANAVLDGTDAVMLSAETAAGKYPAKSVAAMARICLEAEKQKIARVSGHRLNTRFSRTDEAIAMATMYTANHFGVKAIVALTESGATPLWMSRISSEVPIFALSSHVKTSRKMTLYKGVKPILFDTDSNDHVLVNKQVVAELQKRSVVKDGDLVIITKGDLMGVVAGTNAMKIVCVGEMAEPQTT